MLGEEKCSVLKPDKSPGAAAWLHAVGGGGRHRGSIHGGKVKPWEDAVQMFCNTMKASS